MKTSVTFVLILCLSCCNNPNTPNSYALSEKEASVGRVLEKALVQLKKDKELYPFGIVRGRGKSNGTFYQIKTLGLSFRYYKPVDIEKSRELLFYSTELFNKIINGDEKIRPYLDNYPFKPENIEITIYLLNPNGSKPALGELIIVEMLGGKLKYLIKNLETQRLTTVYQESFEEASIKLQEKAAI